MYYYLNKEALLTRCEPVVVCESLIPIDELIDNNTVCFYSENGLPIYLYFDGINVIVPNDLTLHQLGIINIDTEDYIDINGNIRNNIIRR